MNKVKEVKSSNALIGYIVDGISFYPLENCDIVKEWLAEGNTPEPEFTEEELAQQELNKKIQEAKAYLASTDYKMTVDYFATLSKEIQDELILKRSEAREFIRANQ